MKRPTAGRDPQRRIDSIRHHRQALRTDLASRYLRGIDPPGRLHEVINDLRRTEVQIGRTL